MTNNPSIEERICIAGSYSAENIALIRELMEEQLDNEITRIQNIGIGMANEIERQRLEIKNLKEQLAIASEQVPKGAFVFNNKLIERK